MKLWEKLAEQKITFRHLLDKYLEIRMYFKELGYTNEDLKKIGSAPPKLWRLRGQLDQLQDTLFAEIVYYGFDVNWDEFAEFLKPKYDNIDKITPLNNGNTKRNN